MNLTKIGQVAAREFIATVSTKGFIVGLLLMPAVFAVAFTVVPRLMNQRGRPIEGQVIVVDGTGRVAEAVTRAMSQEAVDARRVEALRQAQAAMPEAVRGVAPNAAERVVPQAPLLTIVARPGPFDRERERQWLLDREAVPKHLAVVVVAPDALVRNAQGEYGGYTVYAPVNMDARVENGIYDGVRDALVAARTQAQGVNVADAEAMLRVPRARPTTVAAQGDSTIDPGFSRALPFVFMFLMFMGTMIGGQGLLGSTIEEKSSRVVEVLLSAVSPLELMIGKLLGQLGVGLVAMGVYIGLGMSALTSFAMFGLLDISLVGYLLLFFVITYLLLGSIMMAIGSAVNELREAQSLMTPVTVVLMVPFFIMGPIMQNPSSTFATVVSFVPPVNTFAMLMRMTSTAPPPTWQVWATAGIGLLAAAAAIWCAAKIYRIGLLMYGKPPNMATLVRWVRAA